MNDIISILIKRNGQKEHKLKGTSKQVANSFNVWLHKEMGDRKIRWKK